MWWYNDNGSDDHCTDFLIVSKYKKSWFCWDIDNHLKKKSLTKIWPMFWDLIWNLSRYYISKHSYHFHFLFWEPFLILLNLFCLCLLLNAFCVFVFLYSYSNGKLWNLVPVVLSFSFHISLKGESHIMMMMSVVMCFTLCVPPLCQYRKSSTPFFLLNECHTIVISITVKESSALKYGRGWFLNGSLLFSTKMTKKANKEPTRGSFIFFSWKSSSDWLLS